MAFNESSRIKSQIDEKERKMKWLDDEVALKSRELESANRKARECSEAIQKCIDEKARHAQEVSRLTKDLHDQQEQERKDAEGKSRR